MHTLDTGVRILGVYKHALLNTLCCCVRLSYYADKTIYMHEIKATELLLYQALLATLTSF